MKGSAASLLEKTMLIISVLWMSVMWPYSVRVPNDKQWLLKDLQNAGKCLPGQEIHATVSPFLSFSIVCLNNFIFLLQQMFSSSKKQVQCQKENILRSFVNDGSVGKTK